MPDEEQKRSLWAGISSSSFQQALQFFQKETHPYEYAMVCNNYANALGKYPEAVHTDNFEKALFYYNEALEVRSAKAWPFERAVTLLNYVEACWHLNIAGKSNQALFEEMKAKTREAFELTTDPKMREEARNQMEKLETLRLVLDAEN
jgi:tetratricopeptide (TPR) repeat protein